MHECGWSVTVATKAHQDNRVSNRALIDTQELKWVWYLSPCEAIRLPALQTKMALCSGSQAASASEMGDPFVSPYHNQENLITTTSSRRDPPRDLPVTYACYKNAQDCLMPALVISPSLRYGHARLRKVWLSFDRSLARK